MTDNVDNDPVISRCLDRICAAYLRTAASMIKDIDLDEAGEDSQGLADRLSNVAFFLGRRADNGSQK